MMTFELFYGLLHCVSFFKCLIDSYLGTIPKIMQIKTAILRPLGYPLNIGIILVP